MALLHILTRLFKPGDVEIFAATVDHGLRAGSADEAEHVAAFARQLGLSHETLKWEDWDGKGNLQDQARRARYRLLNGWTRRHGITVLALAHTADDQAETVLMRLARAAGVSGLAAMPVRRTEDGICILRPVLSLSRADLRGYLRRNSVDWVEDPSNDDPRFDRVRIRRAMGMLADLGITVQALSTVARNMGQAREALDWYTFLAARDIALVDAGDVVLDIRRFRTLPDEIARRLMERAIGWIGHAEYPPRRAAMSALIAGSKRGDPGTLGGCRILCSRGSLRICREYNAVRRLSSDPPMLWDRRWRLTGPDTRGCKVRATGRRGLMQCSTWRDTGRPHAALMAAPAVWRDDDLVAAPLAGFGQGWTADLVGGGEEFFASLLSH